MALFATIALHGLRPGEARFLRWGDIARGRLHVRGAIDSLGEEHEPKASSTRTVPLDPVATGFLAELGGGEPTARVFPNPYYASRDGFVTIDNVPAGARVRIFTLRGEQVLDVKANSAGLLTWSGTNGSGRTVASGVYLVMVEFGGSKKILKLAVIR